jgi:hypothetical protein
MQDNQNKLLHFTLPDKMKEQRRVIFMETDGEDEPPSHKLKTSAAQLLTAICRSTIQYKWYKQSLFSDVR